jgi:hypothetical protein
VWGSAVRGHGTSPGESAWREAKPALGSSNAASEVDASPEISEKQPFQL